MERSTRLKFFCLLITIILLISSHNFIFAATKTELNNQKTQTEKKKEEAEKDLKEVENNKTKTLAEVNSLSEKIMNYESEIRDLNQEIKELNISIKQSQEKLNETEIQYKKQEELFNKRLIAIYEAGDTSYLDVLLSSSSITDFISNYYLVSEIATYDTELLDKINKQKEEIENAKKELESSKSKVEVAKKSIETKSNELKAAKTAKAAQVAKLSEEEKKIQSDIDKFNNDMKDIDAKIIAKAKEEEEKNKGGGSSSKPSNPSTSGFIKPINGYSITTALYYSDGRYHGAVDYSGAGITGKPVLASKSGTVTIASYASNSYGNYVQINHHDGTHTLYAHGSKVLVSEGQEVKQGQTVMLVGNTGNSTGPHLHFEIRIGTLGLYSQRVDPRPYLPK